MNIGDYVRTKYGISQCIRVIPIRENSFMYEFDKEVYEEVNYLTASELEKYKTSDKIINLIEVGDYVNGSYVEGFIEKNKFQNKLIITEAGMIDNNDIKSIVTKEMYSSVEYRVEIN